MKDNKLFKNTTALYVMNIAKLILPLVTLPYLTRVLSKDMYGTVSYVKAFMQYMQLLVDFSFLLSGTKDIVNCNNDLKKIERESSDIFGAKLIMSMVACIILFGAMTFIDLLTKDILFTVMSFVVVVLTCFLFDFLFRGIEEMHVISIRFIVMKSISTILTFIFVKNDSDILWIPILDILGSFIAIILVLFELKKRRIRILIPRLINSYNKIKESFMYFLSDIATTAFGALNTLLVGIFCSESQVADWSLCMQMIVAVQSMYTPLINSIYPEMVRNKNIKLIFRYVKICMPIILIGCIFTLFVAEYALLLVGGPQYSNAAPVLRALVPVLLFSFPAMLFGWPTLGSIGRVKETTKTTVITALIQVIGLVLLVIVNRFTLINIAMLRGATEFLLLFFRGRFCYRYRNEFINSIME